MNTGSLVCFVREEEAINSGFSRRSCESDIFDNKLTS